ncbi:DUF4136 domain-containing protein [Oxalobacteraceae bacterium]|nr:DUF4136 domain-containing protein [Oxalobacteraceae bacterium]
MKILAIAVTAAALLLSGCATTIRSNVTAFNEWPTDLPDKSYVYAAPAPADDTLEYRSYQALVDKELARLGFSKASGADQARLRVAMNFSTTDHPARVLLASDPFWPGPNYWGMPGYRRYSRFGYSPFFYDPLRYSQLEVEERVVHNYERKLHVTINAATGKKLFDVTVVNTSRVQATPQVMPALVQSAFAGFPGKNGVPYRVDLKIDPAVSEQEAELVVPAGGKG